MITKVQTTVLDLTETLKGHGKFEKLSVESSPGEAHDVPNKEWIEDHFLPVTGDFDVNDGSLTFINQYPRGGMALNMNRGEVNLGPSIYMGGPGSIAADGDLYFISENSAIHFMFGSNSVSEAREVFCIHENEIVSNMGALIMRSPNVVGSPDPSPYILMESLAPGEPQALGGSLSPTIVLSNPDAPAQSYPYQYTKISNRDGTILQVEGDNVFSNGAPVSTGTPVFAIQQKNGVYFDFFLNVLKRAGEPVDPDDVATKRYVDEFGGSVITSSSFGPTGYAMFQGGLIMQWGSAPAAPSGIATVVLPISWNTGFMVGFCAAEVAGETKAGSVVNSGNSQVTITYNRSGAPVDPVGGSWIALGY